MTTSHPETGKKYFTVAQANAMLPLVRAIVQDIVDLAKSVRERHELLHLRGDPEGDDGLTASYREERTQAQDELDNDQQRLQDYVEELQALGVEFKGFDLGLVDFPCWMDGREVYLCWKLGEPAVGFWHETDAGFAGRQKLEAVRCP